MLENLVTEKRNPDSMNLDELSVMEIIRLMNREDLKVISAVGKALPEIEQVIQQCVNCMKQGGRIIYVGAAPAAG